MVPFGFPDSRQIEGGDIIVWIHKQHLFLGGSSHDFHDFYQMMKTVLGNKKGALIEYFQNDAAGRPYIDANSIVSSAEYQFRSSIAPGTDIGYIGVILAQYLCRA